MKTILVTGATDGIGLQTARDLVLRGHRVILHGRNPRRLEAAASSLGQLGAVETVQADLSELAHVRELGRAVNARFADLDVLINNAGVYMNDRLVTPDGFELTFAVNHLAPFLLTHLLLPTLRARRGRVVNVSSVAHTRGAIRFDDLHFSRRFDPYAAYAQSKLANVLFTVELARRLGDDPDVTVNALHPGVVSTKLLTEGFGFEGSDSLADGAATSLHLATEEALARVTGAYFVNRHQAPMNPDAHDPALTARFYDLSAQLSGAVPLPPVA